MKASCASCDGGDNCECKRVYTVGTETVKIGDTTLTPGMFNNGLGYPGGIDGYISDLNHMEPLHPTKQDELALDIKDINARLSVIEDRLANVQLAIPVEYQDRPDSVTVLSQNATVTRQGTIIGSSVVVTPQGADIVFIIKGEGGRIAGISASAVKFL